VTVLALLAATVVVVTPPGGRDSVSSDSASVALGVALGPIARPVGAVTTPLAASDTTPRPRRRAVQVSEWYSRRLTVHRIGSYTMLPLFATQYVLGDKLLDARERNAAGDPTRRSDAVRNAHVATAIGVGTLFTVNTVTGLWNLYDSRNQPEGRKLRTVHALLMLASDAGFVTTGLVANKASEGSVADARRHRNVALVSMAPATIGAAMMWIDRARH
jgi:hypothetical protein